MSARAKWMASIIADVFKIGEYDALEVFRNQSYQAHFDDFIKGVGPSRIFVYYQNPYKVNESNEIIETSTHPEFFVTDGEKVKLKGKGVYFVRTTPPGKPLNASGSNDNEVLFGEISEHTVTSLNTVINQVYKPMVDKLEVNDWGVCEIEQKKEFTSVFDKFAYELKEALKSLQTNITLEHYDRKYDQHVKDFLVNNKNPSNEMINEFSQIFNSWSNQIQEALEGADAIHKEEKDSGPK